MRRTVTQYAEALYEVVSSSPKEAKEIVSRFVLILTNRGDKRLLPQILNRLEILEHEKLGTLLVEVATPFALTESQRKQIVDFTMTQHKDIKAAEIIEHIQPDLIAGIRLKIGDTVIDHSVQSKLSQLAANL